ncbi:penicillin-binding protein activator [Acinetobacter shaoyimingii]|uniref:Penicillin-binding protein activator n=1 Tax=Acinetobacter shaoyimingii TaxID=2715164 RepID=A0A6G8RWW4_9GAMM|nr:penicillin-binding protein activator [Acinetobacter shaoyimingii]QIO06432.1 hypothetical protein G8E00_10940 [Acinetobacter shaoyimingii]
MLNIMNNKKRMFCCALMGVVFQAQAEVLVILPESGPMARAAESIKLGIVKAHEASKANIPLKFVNTDQKNISDVLKKNVTKSTNLIIGPLARQEVESLIQTNPKIPVLALNEVASKNFNVLQYSLSKDQDTSALLNVMKKDGVNRIYVIREKGTEAESLTFVNALFKKFPEEVQVVDAVPNLKSKDGLLLLGSNTWLNQFKKLPTKHIYAQAISVEQQKPLPKGLKFCDVPALYLEKWQDVAQVHRENPTTMPYKRLYAFGADAWFIAEQFVLNPAVKDIKFNGRTGQITIIGNQIYRVPQCYEQKRKGLSAL